MIIKPKDPKTGSFAMENTEACLELLLHKLQIQIVSKIKSLKQNEFSNFSKTIPTIFSLLEYRQNRDEFLSKFNNPSMIPDVVPYSTTLLQNAFNDFDISRDINSSLIKFFESEHSRVSRIRTTVLNRTLKQEFRSRTQNEFALFDESVTKYLFQCQKAILRLNIQESDPFSKDDLLLELHTKFFKKRRKALLKSVLNQVTKFQYTIQESIYTQTFDSIEQKMKLNQNRIQIPYLTPHESEIEEQLTVYAKRFEMTCDFEASDGQQFLYETKKIFLSLFEQLDFSKIPRRNFELEHVSLQEDLAQLTQKSLLATTPHDGQLKKVLTTYFTLSIDEINKKIDRQIANYNLLVGNAYRSSHFHDNKERHFIPFHKIESLFDLRFIHSKFLATAVFSHINYFEYVKFKLNENATEPSEFYSRRASFPQIIEICDKNGAFIYESAFTEYESLLNHLIGVGSYYISKFEETMPERSGDASVVIEHEKIAEKLLEFELQFLNAKRKLVQCLIECLEHVQIDDVHKMIYEIIYDRPNFNFPIYNSFEIQYQTAIDLTEKKATILRTLINLQIMHERSLSSRFGDQIPYFDRPSQIPTENNVHRIFDESVPVTPFEVYESLSIVPTFLSIVPQIAKEIGESIDVKFSRYSEFLEMSIWKEIEHLIGHMVENGLFPFDRASTPFHFKLSPCLTSLFVSPYVNTLDTVKRLFENMKESRQKRFMLSTRRFMHLSWKLQTLIIDTDLLQYSYYRQCDRLGIETKSIYKTPFKDVCLNEVIDLPNEKSDLGLLEASLIEFQAIEADFCDPSSIKDIIYVADFALLRRMIQFQNLQNTILEISVRYNRHYLDNEFLLKYFDLDSTKATFLTSALTDEDHFKQNMANMIFYHPLELLRNQEIANNNKSHFSLCINSLKSISRAILAAQVKQKQMDQQEMFDLYLNEILDQFAVFIVKIEISRICQLEKRVMLSNSFVDTFVLGPQDSCELIDSQGRFSKFFYVPSWAECFIMLCDAPRARQKMILKYVLKFVLSRYRILNLARFESSLSQRIEVVFDSLYNQTFQMETPIFQQLQQQFEILPNSNEVEILTKFILENEKILFHRLEYSILTTLESFFVSVDSSKQNNFQILDMKFDEKLKKLWIQMHEPIILNKSLFNDSRYVPLWETQFVFNCYESDRNDIVTNITSTDIFLDEALTSMYKEKMKTDPIANIPLSIDFLCLIISQLHLKYAYFLLREGHEIENLDLKKTILDMNVDIFMKNSEIWDSIIIQQVNKHFVPKDESSSYSMKPIPEPKLVQSIFDVIRNQVDLILLSEQIKTVTKLLSEFDESETKSETATAENVDTESKMESSLSIQTSDFYDAQFVDELEKARTYINAFLYDELQNSYSASDDQEEFVIDAVKLHNYLSHQSFLMNEWENLSLKQENSTWKKYLANITCSLNYDKEEIEAAEILKNLATERFKSQTEFEVVNRCSKMFLELNTLRQELKMQQFQKEQLDLKIEQKLTLYYNELVNDLQMEIERTKQTESGIRQSVYDKILYKIRRSKKLASKLKSLLGSDESTVSLRQETSADFGLLPCDFDENFLNEIRTKNEELRKKIIMNRILRVMTEIGIKRTYRKVLDVNVESRKEHNAKLWAQKLENNTRENAFDYDLIQIHHKLSETKSEIERLKQQLENEKMTSIQLVHWKAKNIKKIEQMKQRLNQFDEEIEDVNIDQLVRRLDEAQSELDALREDTFDIDEKVEEEIRKPLRYTEKVKTRFKDAKGLRKRMETMKHQEEMMAEKQETYDYILDQLIQQNFEFQKDNETLLKQIEELEYKKAMSSQRAKSVMEDTIKLRAPVLRMSMRQPGRIVKPTIRCLSQSLNRL